MPEIIDNKIYHAGKKVGWIEGNKIKSEEGDRLLGFSGTEHVYNPDMHKIAYIENEALHFENGQQSVSLDKINEEIRGTYPLNIKCAVYVLFED